MKKCWWNVRLRVEPAVKSKETIVAIIDTGKAPEAQRSELCVMAGERVAERGYVCGTATPHSRILCLSSYSKLHV